MDISLNGIAEKYTNFVYGYQERFFRLRNGSISYYVSKESESEGPRKYYTLTNFTLEHAPDQLRIDILFPDDRWNIRFRTFGDYTSWKDALEAFLPNSNDIMAIPPSPSSNVSSACASVASESSGSLSPTASPQPISQHDVVALRTMRDALPSRFAGITRTLETLTERMGESESRLEFANSRDGLDDLNRALVNCRNLKRDVVYLKNVIKSIAERVEAHQRRTDSVPASPETSTSITTTTTTNMVLKKRTDRSAAIGESNGGHHTPSTVSLDGEDEVWADALDVSRINITQNDATGPATAKVNDDKAIAETTTAAVTAKADDGKSRLVAEHLLNRNPIFHEIDRVTKEQLRYAMTPVDGSAGWEQFFTDGDMKMYRIENEDADGIACDPLKALHSVPGVSAKEYIDTFFDPSLKKIWDDTIVSTNVIETLDEHTVIIHQTHKRIWPSAQRESLFWSQRADVTAHREPGALDAFLVCNFNTERKDVKLPGSSVRVRLKIAMLCQTHLAKGGNADAVDRSKLGRDDIMCKITYVAQIHPGGWVPSAGVRQVAKREYPRFLRQFTAFVEKSVKNRPLNM